MVASYNNPWIYNDAILETEDVEEYVGMVYLIENTVDLRYYVGKKFFWSNRKLPPLKGKKRKRTKRVESDWKNYYGSSNNLLNDVERLGFDKFKRSVLHLCKTKTQCSYYEMKEQVDRNVLLTEDYYNEFIGVKINGKQLEQL
jgi:hypothetical protein